MFWSKYPLWSFGRRSCLCVCVCETEYCTDCISWDAIASKKHYYSTSSKIKIKKATIQNVDFSIREGGGHIIIIFPNVNVEFKCFSWTKNKLILKWFLGNFKCFKLMVFDLT